MDNRLRRLLDGGAIYSARTLRRMLGVTPGELLILLRLVGAVRCDRGGRVLWRLP